MILYPTIELMNGRCVSLVGGDLDNPQIWHVDPVKKAREFAAAGAEWMSVTDLDAVAGTGNNDDLIARLIRAAGIPVLVAGGIRSADHASSWLEAGAGRVVMGTAAVLTPDVVKAVARQHPDQIVIAMDVSHDRLMVDGRRTESMIAPAEFLKSYETAQLAGVQITDVEGDSMGSEGAMGRIASIAAQTRIPVIASGIVRTVDDVSRLNYIPGIAGAVVGRALFNRTVDLQEALASAVAPAERTAEFI